MKSRAAMRFLPSGWTATQFQETIRGSQRAGRVSSTSKEPGDGNPGADHHPSAANNELLATENPYSARQGWKPRRRLWISAAERLKSIRPSSLRRNRGQRRPE